MSNNNFEDLLEQIEEWHEEDEHSNIIEAVLDIPDSDRGYELTCLLARAYNNLDEYENALNLLLSVKDEGKYDVLWHFRIGYAYYYLDYLEEAETAFNRVLESDPENEDAIDFITWIQEEREEAAEIKPKQEIAALEDMIEWLSHENELGTAPSEIELAGEFDLHGLHYYIFKYKKSNSASSPWLLGVAGGYSRFDLEHCGHVFSEMEEYFPEKRGRKSDCSC
jgi:Tetratricopeptide repeat.